eukprot:3666346-Amphidinium_carterae.1
MCASAMRCHDGTARSNKREEAKRFQLTINSLDLQIELSGSPTLRIHENKGRKQSCSDHCLARAQQAQLDMLSGITSKNHQRSIDQLGSGDNTK